MKCAGRLFLGVDSAPRRATRPAGAAGSAVAAGLRCVHADSRRRQGTTACVLSSTERRRSEKDGTVPLGSAARGRRPFVLQGAGGGQ